MSPKEWGEARSRTFDVSVVEVHGAQLTVLSTEGIPHLGGNDLDECLRWRVLDEMEAKFGKRPTRESDALFFQDLDQKVTAAKISLATRPEVPIVVGYEGSQIILKVTQQVFHRDIDPLIGQSLEALDRALDAASLKVSDVDHLVMVGGTSRFPYIQERLANHTGVAPKTDIDPEQAIAKGAALACAAKRHERGEGEGKTIPGPDIFIRDVTAHAIGCCIVDNRTSNRRLASTRVTISMGLKAGLHAGPRQLVHAALKFLDHSVPGASRHTP